jgi:hypothetical protein
MLTHLGITKDNFNIPAKTDLTAGEQLNITAA